MQPKSFSGAGIWAHLRTPFATAPLRRAKIPSTKRATRKAASSVPPEERMYPVVRGLRNAVLPSALLWGGIIYLCFG